MIAGHPSGREFGSHHLFPILTLTINALLQAKPFEVVIANFLSSPTYRTVPVQMWAQITERVDPTVAAMASVLFVVSMAMMLGLTALRWRQSQ